MKPSQSPSSLSRRAFLALAGAGCAAAYVGRGAPATEKAVATPSSASMAFPEKDWTVAPPASQGVDPAKLDAAVDNLREAMKGHGGIEEMLIVRNGRAIWQGASPDLKHGIWSASKSFTSTVLGLLIGDGKCTLDTLAKDHVPELAKDYPEVKLRHFATMTSGYDGEGGTYALDMLDGSRTPFIPTKPLFLPGTEFRYWDDAMREFGHVLTRIAGEPLESFFRRRVAEPIGIPASDWGWRRRDTVRGVEIMDSAGGVDTTARQLARFGHLFLNRGKWAGKQLVSAEWVAQAGSVQVPVTTPWKPYNKRQERIDGRGVYGFNWWVNGVTAKGPRYWPGAPPKTFAALGLFENRCYIVPEWNMVVAHTGTDRNRVADSELVWSNFFAKLAEAVA